MISNYDTYHGTRKLRKSCPTENTVSHAIRHEKSPPERGKGMLIHDCYHEADYRWHYHNQQPMRLPQSCQQHLKFRAFSGTNFQRRKKCTFFQSPEAAQSTKSDQNFCRQMPVGRSGRENKEL